MDERYGADAYAATVPTSVSPDSQGAAVTTAVVEDSGAGIRSARSAGARVVAVPKPNTDPGPGVLDLADARIASLRDLVAALVGLG